MPIFIRAYYGIHARAIHVQGEENTFVDAISRSNLPLLFSKDRFLTMERFVTDVQRALEVAGNNFQKYLGHSFRIGVPSQYGLQDLLIEMLRWWESMPRVALCSVAKQGDDTTYSS